MAVWVLSNFVIHTELITAVTGSFRFLFAHASRYQFRIVLINQREYPGSSPLNEQEMTNLWSQEPDKQAAAIRDQGFELATFIARFIEGKSIPAPRIVGGKMVGGISLLAWSQGNGPLMSLLANIPRLDVDMSALLGQYMRVVFMYG